MKTLITLSFVLISALAFSQTDQARTSQFNTHKDIALEGYDPVSYFEGKPTEGQSSLKASYRGILYLFSTKEHLERFKTNPAMFEPAYGGWCAFAMGENGDKVKIDPETYKIVENKLYLFYNFWGNNTLDTWNVKEKELKSKADKNWKKFIP